MNETFFKPLLNMSHKTSLAFLFIFFSTGNNLVEISASKEPSSVCDLLSSKPVNYDTSSPVNVITKKVTKGHVNSSLILQTVLLPPLRVRNTGYILAVEAYPFERPLVKISGGVLCSRTYIFEKTVFFASDNTKLSSFSEINGKGSPLTLSLIFYNAEYGSFNESLKHRDGLVIQSLLFKFSVVDNPLFYPFQPFFSLLREPGSEVILPAGVTYAAFSGLFELGEYYSYYGSYIELETGVQYPCAIYIQATKIISGISKLQFDNSLLILKNTKGGKLVSRQPAHQMGKRPVYKADKRFSKIIKLF